MKKVTRMMGLTRQKKIYLIVVLYIIVLVMLTVLKLSTTQIKIETRNLIMMMEDDVEDDDDEIIIDKNHAPRPLIFTITTFSYDEFTKNWILSLEKNKMYDYMIICCDLPCSKSLISWKDSLHVELAKEYIPYNNTNNDTEAVEEYASKELIFGTSEFIKLAALRPIIYKNLYLKYVNKKRYKQNKYSALLYLDSDMVIVNNFIPLLYKKYLYHIHIK